MAQSRHAASMTKHACDILALPVIDTIHAKRRNPLQRFPQFRV
jgi:hypothetical protein